MTTKKTVHTGCLIATITSDGCMEEIEIEWDKDVPANIACAILDCLRDSMDSAAWISNHLTEARGNENEKKSDEAEDYSDRTGVSKNSKRSKRHTTH